MIKKKLFSIVLLLLLIFSFFVQIMSVKADELVIQDDGKIVLIIGNNGVLGVTSVQKEPEKIPAPPQHSEQKQQPTSAPPPNSSPQTSVKTVPLVAPQTQSIVHISAPINDDKKVQVTVTTQTTLPTVSPSVKTQSLQTPIAAPIKTIPTNVITKNVDQVVAQGSNGLPVITIKSEQAHQLTIEQGTTHVTTILPLQIDTLSHSLSVTSKEQPIINVLPTEALQGIMNKGLLNSRNVHQAKVNLTQDANGVNYTVDSQKQGKLFGLFSVESAVQVKLSAQTGKVVTSNQSLLFNLFGGFIK